MENSKPADRLRRLIVEDPLEDDARSPEACSRRFRLALKLSDDGLEMMQMNLRRRHPDYSEDQLEEALRAWLGERPPTGYIPELMRYNPNRFNL